MNALQVCLDWMHENNVDYEGVINEDGTISIIHDGEEEIFNERHEHIRTLYDVTDLSRYLRYNKFKYTVSDINGDTGYIGEDKIATFNAKGAITGTMNLHDPKTYCIVMVINGTFYNSYRHYANDVTAMIDGGMFALAHGCHDYAIVNNEGVDITKE
jgi:hypothetical protein